MKIVKRIGYGVLSFVPLLGTILIQAVVIAAVTAVVMMRQILEDGMSMNPGAYVYLVNKVVADHYIALIAAIQLTMLFVFGLWYYLAYMRKKSKKDVRILLRLKNLAGFLLIGFSFYLLIVLCLAGIEKIAPEIIAEYESLVDFAGIADLTLLSTLSTMVLAPFGEEIVFRGLTMNYLKKAGAPFILANLIQAALFGFAHFNWVQSSYAFVLGLLLGYLVHYFDTLAASILFHSIFNFIGTYVAMALEKVPVSGAGYVVLAVLAGILPVLGYRLMRGNGPVHVTDD